MKYVAYCRVSTQEQGRSGLGLQAQKSLIENAIGADNVVEWYSEVQSGKIKNRAILNKALERAGELRCGFVVAKLDRLGRNVAHLFQIREKLEENNIALRVADSPQMNTITFGIYAVVAQHEREMISQRTREALAEKKKQGVKLGRPPLPEGKKKYYKPVDNPMSYQDRGKLGGKKSREKALPIYVEKITPIINLIKLFRASNPDATDAQLVAYLNQINYPTLSGRGRWHQSSILRLKKYQE